MKGTLVVLVLVLAAVAAFAVQNPGIITVRFLTVSGTTSLLVVIVAAFAAGVLAGWLAGLPGFFRRRGETAAAHKRLQELEIEAAALRGKVAPPAAPEREERH